MPDRTKNRSREFPITLQAMAIWIAILGSVAGYQILTVQNPAPLTTTIDTPHESVRAG